MITLENGLAPVLRQSITRITDDLLPVGPEKQLWWTNTTFLL